MMKTTLPTGLLAIFMFSLLLFQTGCSGRVEQGKVTGFGQSMGVVQSFVRVELADGTEVKAWLPQDDELWTKMQRYVRNGGPGEMFVEIRYNRSKDYWEYLKIVEKE
jgi:hypothetical protein